MAGSTRQEVSLARQQQWIAVVPAVAMGLVTVLATLVVLPAAAWAGPLDEMSLERWAKLREAERYQLNIAEKYYREKDYQVAQAEYEKFLTLYESSEGAPYAQLKWSLCQIERRNLNTAIKDGFQSVIDYWPDSPEATSSAYFIARTYKDMGEVAKAKKAFADVISQHGQHLVGVLARVQLIDMARVEGDGERQVALWRQLTFDTPRAGDAGRYCVEASQALARYYLSQAALTEAVQALATTYPAEQVPTQLIAYVQAPVSSLVQDASTKQQGQLLADRAIAYLREQMPTDLADEKQKARAREYWFAIADLQHRSGRAEQVAAVYDQMIKTFGVDDGILDRLAAFYKSSEQRDQARATYGRFADKAAGMSKIALMDREEKKYDAAIGIYRQLVAMDQEKAAQWNNAIATTYREAGKCNEAVAMYQQLIKLAPEQADQWLWNVADCYQQFGKYKEAIAAYRQSDRFPAAYQRMADCHLHLKEWGPAYSLYQQIRDSHEPLSSWAQLQMAHTLERAGDKEKAILAFQRVCEKYPKSSHASAAHAHLQNEYKINVTLGGAKD